MPSLTDAQCRNAKNDGKAPKMIGDGNGLYLKTTATGAKSWVLKVVVRGGSRITMTLGYYGKTPFMGLRDAREASIEARGLAKVGINPLQEKRATIEAKSRDEEMLTFAEAAELAHGFATKDFRSEKNVKSWLQRLERYAFESLGSKRLDTITRFDVCDALEPLWNTKKETARRVRRGIYGVFQWALGQKNLQGSLQYNPAEQNLIVATLGRLKIKPENMRAIDHKHISEAMRVMDESHAPDVIKLAFRFLALTAARRGEVLYMRWHEVDGERRLWIIPKERTKAFREHREPLTDEALDVLEKAREFEDGSGLVFPSHRISRQPIGPNAIMRWVHRAGLGEKMTLHGLRSTFRTWCADNNQPRELAETALSHLYGDTTEQAYIRSDALDSRRVLMEQWANHITGK